MGEAETHLAARDRVYLTEIRETWRRLERFGRDDRDHGNLADGRPILGELGRRPTPITVNAQTKIS